MYVSHHCTISSSHDQVERTLYTQNHEKLPVQSTVSTIVPYRLFEQKSRNKNKFVKAEGKQTGGNIGIKLGYTNFIQYCS